jgi:hypothetical protein
MRAVVALIALCSVASAQEMPCEPCAKGDDVLAQLPDHGQAIRNSRDGLVGQGIDSERIAPDDLSRLRAWAAVQPGLRDDIRALASTSPEHLHEIAASVCSAPDGDCVLKLQIALLCLTNRCYELNNVLPNDMQMDRGLRPCDPSVNHIGSSRAGLGFEWANGWQDDRFPVDGRAWSLGFEARARLTHRFGFVGRVDRSTGRDAAEVANGDGRDDRSTGEVTRMYVLAGPSYMFGIQHDRDIARYAQVDLLAGYQATLSQPDEDGAVTGFDLSYTLAVARMGVRALQGFGRADDSRAVLVHAGFVFGAGPRIAYGSGCGYDDEKRDTTRWALALDLPLFGYGLSSKLDYVVPGFGLEGAYHASSVFDVMLRADLLDLPNGDRDRTVYSTVLAGGRFDFAPKYEKSTKTGFFTTLMVGYAHAATVEPTTAGSGPVLDAGVGWGGQGDDGGAFLRVHGRFCLTPDNADSRAVFLSGTLELRLDRRKWRDRM